MPYLLNTVIPDLHNATEMFLARSPVYSKQGDAAIVDVARLDRKP